MNFDFSEDQKFVQKTARDYLDEHCGLDVCRADASRAASSSATSTQLPHITVEIGSGSCCSQGRLAPEPSPVFMDSKRTR